MGWPEICAFLAGVITGGVVAVFGLLVDVCLHDPL